MNPADLNIGVIDVILFKQAQQNRGFFAIFALHRLLASFDSLVLLVLNFRINSENQHCNWMPLYSWGYLPCTIYS